MTWLLCNCLGQISFSLAFSNFTRVTRLCLKCNYSLNFLRICLVHSFCRFRISLLITYFLQLYSLMVSCSLLCSDVLTKCISDFLPHFCYCLTFYFCTMSLLLSSDIVHWFVFCLVLFYFYFCGISIKISCLFPFNTFLFWVLDHLFMGEARQW